MKKRAKMFLVTVCVLTAALLIAVIWYISRPKPYDPSLTPEHIQNRVAFSDKRNRFLVKLVDPLHEENVRCYEAEPSYNFVELFAFDQWELTEEKTDSTPVMAFRLAEEWVIELYNDGKIAAHDGYAPRKYESAAYYTVPAEIITALSAYIEANGELQEIYRESDFLH